MKVLAIGNSFSQDATAYLKALSEHFGTGIYVKNMAIGGCSLKTHWENVENQSRAYIMEVNGEFISENICLNEMIAEDSWDFITLQQASHDSGIEASYSPYIENMVDYIKANCPGAEIVISETWAYEPGCEHSEFPRYDCDSEKMYEKIKQSYYKKAAELNLRVIPCGDIIQSLRRRPEFDTQNGGISLCRDGFHMSFTYGRYAVAAAWHSFFTNRKMVGSSFVPWENEPADLNLIALINKTVDDAVFA